MVINWFISLGDQTKKKQKCEKKWVWIRREASYSSVGPDEREYNISSIVLCTGESHLGISMAIVYLWDCNSVQQTGYIYISVSVEM